MQTQHKGESWLGALSALFALSALSEFSSTAQIAYEVELAFVPWVSVSE
jgi:hypothetical protein